jgi:hypothetical protein
VGVADVALREDPTMATPRATIRDNIAAYGQHVMRVLLTADDPPDAPEFMYTIGNHEHGLPELLIVGFGDSPFVGILNDLGSMQRRRRRGFIHDQVVDLGGSFPVRIVDAGRIGREEYAIQVGVYYRTEAFEVRQVLICDRRGRFPDDPDCEEPYSKQPILSSMRFN